MAGDDEHPLLLELSSLRQTAARFQHEAHAAAIKLQRHSRDSLRIHEHAAALEQETARLTYELSVLRISPEEQNHPAEAQAQELSLALRRVNDKITLTENTLLERTSGLTDARSELVRARHTADAAYELAARMRAREEAAKARERELEFRARAAEEERKLVDLVVQEYADLVRNLEGRKSVNHAANGSTLSLHDTLRDGKSSLHGMLTAFSTELEHLHATINELNGKVSDLQMTLDAERLTAAHDRMLLAQTQTELDKLNLEDQTAAKMVARYMKFSQAATNALQKQIMTLKARHTSTIGTLELQLSMTQSQLASERAHSARLQDALDELCEDLARESYGRRREVALRIALLSREEGVAEFMQRWVWRARELYARCYNSALEASLQDPVQQAFHRVVSDAESILYTLDDDVQFSDATRTSGSLARIALSRDAVEALRNELQDEVLKRMEAVRKSVHILENGHPYRVVSGVEDLEQTESAPPKEDGDTPDRLPLTREAPPVELPTPEDADSPVSMVGASQESIDDPFVVSAPVAPPVLEISKHTTIEVALPSPSIRESTLIAATLLADEEPKSVQPSPPIKAALPSPSIRDSTLTEATLLADEETKSVQPSPSVSVLDLRQDLHLASTEEPLEVVPIDALRNDAPVSPPLGADQNADILTEEGTPIPSTLISTPTPALSQTAEVLPSPSNPLPTLLAELGATKHRYDALQRAFRDCSLALKELKHTLASPSPSSTQTRLRQHLETALARINDYSEDARVELEIRVADEELALCGFETVLSVPGALADADERAEIEASARAFVDGTDEGVVRALEKFGKKLEDVQHDVAVVKRAVHELGSEDDEGEEGRGESGESGDGKDGGWTAWTAGLLGTPTRSPTPVQTFGAVMTSPRPRDASLVETEQGLAGLDLRIPMPLHAAYVHPSVGVGVGPGLGRAERPRTLSPMYAMYGVAGWNASKVGLGVGLGSPVRRVSGRMEGSAASPLRAGGGARVNANARDGEDEEVHDLGGVE